MADFGIKIAQQGFDVRNCDDKDLVMSSKLQLLKVALTGTASSPVAHGLSYIPIFFSNRALSAGQGGLVGDDLSNVDVTNFNPFSAGTRYYIFYHQF